MTKLVIPLDAAHQSNTALVGAKAATLGTLLDIGFPVPPGLCVTAHAFRLACTPVMDAIQNILCESPLDTLTSAETAAQAISDLTANITVPLSLKMKLGELGQFESGVSTWAVRSSATAEDQPTSSFAGQYHSVLGVRTEHDLHEAILACWRSFFEAHALISRSAHGALDKDQAMAVLIQPVIDAECAGVCFGVAPVRRHRDLAVIHAAWGLGIGVVDGSVATDTIWVRRRGFKIDERQIVEQAEQIALDPAGGVRRVPVPASHRRSACLPDRWSKRIAQFGVAIETLFASPQDIEWAISENQVWILQSRPITALPAEMSPRPFPVQWETEADHQRPWTLLELDGREGDALLPLEIDYETVKESIREETCLFIGADRNQKIQVYNGRLYETPLPFPLPESDRLKRRAAFQEFKSHLWDEGKTTWNHWGPEIVQAADRLCAFNAENTDGPQLAQHLEETLVTRRRYSMLHPMMGFRPHQSYLDAFELISGLGGQAAQNAAYGLLDSGETPFAHLVDDLDDLAQIARQEPNVTDLVADPPADVMEQLEALPEAKPFYNGLARFLSRYGERSGRGYGFEPSILTPTWHQDPSPVLGLIAAYMNSDTEPPAKVRARTRQARDRQAEAYCAASPDQNVAAEFRRQLAQARRATTVLEYHNHYLDQIGFGVVRHAVQAAARWLAKHGTLADTRDVFWLTFEEIGRALRSDTRADWKELVAGRKKEHAHWMTMDAPFVLGVPEAKLRPRPPLEENVIPRSTSSAGLAIGLGASPGQVSGQARVVGNTVVLPELSPGDVLVARNISPRWTPLLAVVHAIVIDEGGPGQHAAVLAREYGVPAVVDTVDGTRRIPNGAWVTVDGTAGTVEFSPGDC